MDKGFSKVLIGLHWAVTTTVAWAHIIAGSLVLILVSWRLALRFTRGVPTAPEGEGRMLKLAGDAGHLALYLLMIAMPVSGLLAWYGGVTTLGDLHGGALKVLLWIVIGLPVVAAFYHHFILKDGLLNRMRKQED